MRKLRPMEIGKLFVFTQPLNGRTGVEPRSLWYQNVQVCTWPPCLSQCSNRWKTWVRIQSDSKRRFLGDTLCKQRILHWWSEMTLRIKANLQGWRESEMKDDITQVKNLHFPFYLQEKSIWQIIQVQGNGSGNVCVAQDYSRWCTQEPEYLSSKEAQTSAWEKWAPKEWDPAGLGNWGFQAKILAWHLLHAISPLGGICIVRRPVP